MQDILTFDGDNRFLSNFYPCRFFWWGFNWTSSENAYQAFKSLDITVWRQLASPTVSASKSKRIGKTIALRPDWETIKFEMMLQIVRAKFQQNPHLTDKLKLTENARLEEGNLWHDRIWGVCPPGSGNGKNALGLILMQIRSEL